MENESINYIKLINKIISYYNVGTFEEFLEVLQIAEDNLILKFKTSMGFYVLKEYSPIKHKDIQKVKLNLKFAKNILDNDKIITPLCSTKNNDPYLEFDGRIFSVDKFIEGDHNIYDSMDERLKNVASILANLHLEEFKELKSSRRFSIFINDFKGIDKILNEYSMELKNKEIKSDVDLFLLNDVFPFFDSDINKLKEDIKKKKFKSGKFMGLIHGDFQPKQIVFNDINIAHLIDYERFNQGFIEHELFKSLGSFSGTKENTVDFRRAKLFLETYKENFGENLEIDSSEVLLILKHSFYQLLGSSRILINAIKSNNPGSVGAVNFYYKKLLWLHNNETEFIEKLKNN
jgi:Ser/Thr protein kinase RdoA (MazF antagonist)